MRFFVAAFFLLATISAHANEPACVATIMSSAKQAQELVIEEAKSSEPKPVPQVFDSQTQLFGYRIDVDNSAEKVTSRRDAEFKPATMRLLNMLSNTLFQDIGRKLTREKGEMRLAEILDDGSTMEFIFEGDKRSGDSIFRLQKIVLVKPNGADVTLDGAPVDDSGKSLARTAHVISMRSMARGVELKPVAASAFKDLVASDVSLAPLYKNDVDDSGNLLSFIENAASRMHESDRAQVEDLKKKIKTVKVPLTIRGPVLDELLKWGDRLSVLNRSEFQTALQTGKLTALAMKARQRSMGEFMMNIVRKQAFKYALLAAVVVGANHGISLVKEQYAAVSHDPGEKVRASAAAPVSAEGASALLHVVQSFESDPAKARPLALVISKRTTVQPQNRVTALNDVQTLLTSLERTEASLKGDGRYFLGDSNLKGLVTKDSPLASGDLGRAKVQGSTIMISQFEKSGVIVINAFTTDADEFVPATATLMVTEKANPELYARMTQRFDAVGND